uniref:Pyruvate kinase n=1 Tax=Florenciella parvula TaxID=236787 RepID=A0A7S2FZM7_9STRA|eukprot:CAMPEP_0182552866 /NCGR_PEP_ID=MMETSP1323-20130603/49195_1 /TAXON_ID=236787 /ORGANISM="Florenciella parvula, Strain RCC1693" /LENGTH=594 /DNA_ID=CAMNT_0024764579 /DNA_START=68 /DNA_END=1852 /DNA_ORIENTATION=-
MVSLRTIVALALLGSTSSFTPITPRGMGSRVMHTSTMMAHKQTQAFTQIAQARGGGSMTPGAGAPATGGVPASLIASEPSKTGAHVGERWTKNTKQLATVGPASSTYAMLEKLFVAGVDVFRLNFSHGGHEEKAELVGIIRQLEANYNHPIGILADLQGPKQRVGVFESENGVVLVEGQKFRFDLDSELGTATRVQLPHPEIIGTLRPGDSLLIDDGKMRMTVIENGEGYVECRVDVGGKISNRKGVNTPTIVTPISPLTKKDREDLEFIKTLDVDWVALSFVQKPGDIQEMKDLIGDLPLKVMAKLEKPSAVTEYLEDIVALCDGIMVARGDLGVEMAVEDVPVIQKRIIRECQRQGTPVVVATQMLESMIESPTPTRAEASDVATAIYDGADAVMLSAESAAGQYPELAVQTQQKIISRVERSPYYRDANDRYSRHRPTEGTSTDAITISARSVAQTVGAKAIIVFTNSGTTVVRASNGRPSVPIIAITTEAKAARSLSLAWGVYSQVLDFNHDLAAQEFEALLGDAVTVATNKGFVTSPNDLVVVTAGIPFGIPGAVNTLRIVSGAGPGSWPRCYDSNGWTLKVKPAESAN